MYTKSVLTGIALLMASSIQASELELFLGSDTAALKILSDSASVGVGGADLQIGGFFNDADDYLIELGMLVQGRPAGEQPTSYGLGAKAMFGGIDQPDKGLGGIGLGGIIAHHIPANMPVTLSAELYYAPGITSFRDADGMLDMTLRAELAVLPAASAFLGYRQLSVDLDGVSGDYDLDDEIHLGMRFQF